MKSYASLLENGLEFSTDSPKKEEDTAKIAGSATVKKQTPSVPRITAQELEDTYRSTGIVFNGVTKQVSQILSSKHQLYSFGDEQVEDFFNQFLANLGRSSDIVDWESFLYEIFKDCFVFGKFFAEKIYNKNKTRIVDLQKS